MVRISLMLLLVVHIISCQNTPPPQENKHTSSNPTTTKPVTYVDGLPVHNAFETAEEMFHRNTDTTYVINFWATWCAPCVKELPYIEAIHEKYDGKKVKVILVSLDFPQYIESKLVPFLEKHQLQSEVVVLADGDQNAWIPKIDPDWSGTIPVTVVYQKEKRVFFPEAFEDAEPLYAAIDGMLKQ